MRKLFFYYLSIGFFSTINIMAQPVPDSEIWLADIRIKEQSIYFGPANKISINQGYNNQPFFMNDTTILYAHITPDTRSHIFEYILPLQKTTQLTHTLQSEYSPRMLPSKDGFSVVTVEPDSTQRLWAYNTDGTNGKLLAPFTDSVGYYVWQNDSEFVANIITDPQSLHFCNINKKKTLPAAKNIGRCMQISESGNLYFTIVGQDKVRWLCKIEDNGAVSPQIEFYPGVEDFVISNSNIIFCAKGGLIYYTDMNYKLGWRLCGNFESYGLKKIARLALSPNNKKIALVELK